MIALIASIALAQAQAYPFVSQGELEISNLSYPQIVKRFEPVEISFDLRGTWNNPFDPNQIDVSARVVGAENTYAIVNGFVMPEPNAPARWKIRFVPWNIGGYGVFIRVADRLRTIEPPKIGIRVNANDGGFFEVQRNARYFSKNRVPQLLAGWTVEASDAVTAKRLMSALEEAGGTVCRIKLSTIGGNVSEICVNPDLRSFAIAQAVEDAVVAARERGLAVILSLSSSAELSPGKGWEQSQFNKARGGPCEAPEDFWTNLRARLLYKRALRYLFSRLLIYDNIAGVEFFRGIEAPAYWIEEMANEVAGVSIFLTPMSTFPGAEDVWKVTRIGYASIPIEYADTPVGTAAVVVAKLLKARQTTNRPLVPIAVRDAPDEARARAAMWAAIYGGGATGTIQSGSRGMGSFYAFRKFAGRIVWLRRKFVDVVATSSAGDGAWALADDLGAIALVLPASGETSGNLTMPLRRDGNYAFTWTDISSGNEVASGESRASSNQITIPVPRSEFGVACDIVRK